MDLNEFIRRVKTKAAEVELRIAREKSKPLPDALRLDRYEKEDAMWKARIKKTEEIAEKGRYICSKCKFQSFTNYEKCPKCGHLDIGFIERIKRFFGFR